MELEGKDDRLKPTYYKPNPIQVPAKDRDTPIHTCYEVARDRGYNYFGVNNGGWCLGSFDAEFTFKKHGKYTTCKDGKGGQWGSDVYFILEDTSKSIYIVNVLIRFQYFKFLFNFLFEIRHSKF